ncbi:hypothetical protein EPI10_005908 [Gossypium australe]|uniref:Uncharacterized protein n=1 Tax=Gossypium australe TaxID=47621 RepID=A0A5B6WR65_9ROSI|nr:hypothetical protein EPI10_005908 [Gossypium australe]
MLYDDGMLNAFGFVFESNVILEIVTRSGIVNKHSSILSFIVASYNSGLTTRLKYHLGLILAKSYYLRYPFGLPQAYGYPFGPPLSTSLLKAYTIEYPFGLICLVIPLGSSILVY